LSAAAWLKLIVAFSSQISDRNHALLTPTVLLHPSVDQSGPNAAFNIHFRI
jgi:hypothetical protein